MELVKLYPNAVELEMWIKVQESLTNRRFPDKYRIRLM